MRNQVEDDDKVGKEIKAELIKTNFDPIDPKSDATAVDTDVDME